eukprot:scaffold33813_cov62-Phaeocystis_antarctica.AAC.3
MTSSPTLMLSGRFSPPNNSDRRPASGASSDMRGCGKVRAALARRRVSGRSAPVVVRYSSVQPSEERAMVARAHRVAVGRSHDGVNIW